jgi:two-component system sensor histidine kinase UhpB
MGKTDKEDVKELSEKSGFYSSQTLNEHIVFLEELLAAKHDAADKHPRDGYETSESNESVGADGFDRQNLENLRLALLKRIVQSQEDERKRIARDIHDHIGQQITALRLKLHAFAEKYKKSEENAELLEQINEIQAVAEKIDSEVDFLAWELRPSVVDNLGLSAALKIFVQEWSAHFKTPAEFYDVGFDGQRLLPKVEINLYRIAQEALNNIAKHAAATNVSVLLEKRGDTVLLIIEDDGVGFDTSKEAVLTGEDRGMGLIGMKERAELIGGINLVSSKGNGTTVFVRVPARFDESENERL